MTKISSSCTKRKDKHPLEAAEQRIAWAWLGTVPVKSDHPLAWGTLQDFAYMVPNGTNLAGTGKRRAIQMANLKSQGLRTGVSDLVIAYPTYQEGYHGMGGGADATGYFGAYIEMKRVREAYNGPAAIKSAVRPEQVKWLMRMASVGYWVGLAYGAEEFKTLIGMYLRGEKNPDYLVIQE